MTNIITLKPVNDLLGSKFMIPAYQRGYRWTRDQVTALLEDLYEFNNNPKEKDEFYCLQPVVVMKTEKGGQECWELIDGQQRLTTIHIVLGYFNNRFTEEYKKPIYNINYQTREDSERYLSNINEIDKDKNIDYHFIHSAFTTVKEWFKQKQNLINDFESVLLNKTMVIWYEVNEVDIDPIDIFTRINIGKIPLTNAELIKALFLQKSNFHEERASLKQIQIASEWDAMERALQDDRFWFFIYNPGKSHNYDNRLEFIFDLMKNKRKEDEFYHTYNAFYGDFAKSKAAGGCPDIDAIWLRIKRYYMSFEGWYKDRELYHLVGYLVDCGKNIAELKEKSDGLSKTGFKEYIQKEIRNQVNCQLDDLNYGSPFVKKVLLLFNIQTILATREADMRFPFYKYKDENWDIEHVCSQTEAQISSATRKDWAKDLLEYFTGVNGYSDNVQANGKTEKELQFEAVEDFDETMKGKEKSFCLRAIKILDAEKADDDMFNRLLTDVTGHFGENDISDKDSISNLALLDAATNRSYKNAMFPIKRKIIIENDMNGVFVPISTKNLFLKYYSKKMDGAVYWKSVDAIDYLSAIKDILKNYLPVQKVVNE